MENKVFKGKLSLKKETIEKLNNDQMSLIQGGAATTTGSDNLCTSGSCGTLTIKLTVCLRCDITK